MNVREMREWLEQFPDEAIVQVVHVEEVVRGYSAHTDAHFEELDPRDIFDTNWEFSETHHVLQLGSD